MKLLLNKTSRRFLLQFVLIVSVSLALVFAVGYYSASEDEAQVPAARQE